MAYAVAAAIYDSAASLAQFPGPFTRYRFADVDGLGRFRWYPSDTTAADNVTVIAPSGGAAGRWKLVTAFNTAGGPHPRCDVVAISNVTLSGLQTIDGVSLAAGDVVLPVGQTAAAERVPWTVSASDWTRPVWFDSTSDALPGMLIVVKRGTLNGGTIWRMSSPTSGSITLGTTSVEWARTNA